MANLDAPAGAKPFRHLSGGMIRASEYKIASGTSSDIFTGDFVKLLSTGYIDVASAGNRILGVFAGVKYTASDGEVVYKKYFPTGTTTLASADVTAYVYDDPNITYRIQSAGSADFTDIGNLADHVAGSGSTTTGQSGHEVSGTTGTGTAGLRILRLIDDPDNSAGTNGELEVVIYEHELNQHIDADGTPGV
jgi:hypothetical protein|tara:strand:+ start:1324 stop:1899 length:576 start_codon:yes stop_codon:yes gene_type:complete